MAHLLQEPEVWEKLVREVRGSLKTLDDITNLSVSRLPFLDGVVHESTFPVTITL
jgi:hypothetical protein